jgi:DNA (cytosine-5)-methyltransferase 1
MKHIGLFEGKGGFSLAAKWMGWETIAWCEINPFCQQILRFHFPEAKEHHDIIKTDFSSYANTIDILTGGFPCQPFSNAGDQLGADDKRYLFPEMLRAIREIKPRWIVAENVRGIITKKFEELFASICASLEDEGYTFLPLLIPVSAIEAPHERYRVWIVAHSNSNDAWGYRYGKTGKTTAENKRQENKREWIRPFVERISEEGVIADTEIQRLPEWNAEPLQHKAHATIERHSCIPQWKDFPTVSPVRNGNDGVSFGLGDLTISETRWRNESIKADGNAIAPRLAYEIYKAIKEIELLHSIAER